ncbi:MAG TPA: tetratricopeptide repeat protein [Polyangiales bacterium]
MKRALVLLAALATLCATSARADSLSETFARGNAAYARGDFTSAIKAYETLLEAGVRDAAVSYDLACAYGASGQYGAAIQNFERTLREAPGDDAAERGLKLARDLLGERQARERGEAIVAERPPLSSALFASLAENTLAVALLVSSLLWSALLVALTRARAEAVRIGLGIATGFFVLAGLVSGFGLWAKLDFGAEGHRAIVRVDRAPVREGPALEARLAGELNEGESVRVLARDGEFAYVRMGQGREGYVPHTALGEI